MWRNLISAIGSYASLVGLYLAIRPPQAPLSSPEDFLIACSLLFIAWHLYLEIRSLMVDRPKIYRDDNGTMQFMKAWISSGGRATVLSRDMSWVNSEIEEILKNLLVNLTLQFSWSMRLHYQSG
ncbi:MAG TPA: hypothetical protein VGF53_15260 [Pseudolabrys sp.]|jgi:hypothetical protein